MARPALPCTDSLGRLSSQCASSTASLEEGSELCLRAQWPPLYCWLAGLTQPVQNSLLKGEAISNFFSPTLGRPPGGCGAPQHMRLHSTGRPQHHKDGLRVGGCCKQRPLMCWKARGFSPTCNDMVASKGFTVGAGACTACWVGIACRQATVLGAHVTS